jgi:isopentenyl phosphate kinase
MEDNVYMLKIGGSIITDLSKPNTANMGEISRILDEIKAAMSKSHFKLIIGHGSGSFGHVSAAKYRVQEGLIDADSRKGAAITHLVAKELNTMFVKQGLEIGMNLYPFSPAGFGIGDGMGLSAGFTDHIRFALENGFIPVVHGDVIMNYTKGVSISSTEDVLRFISKSIKPSKIFFCTDVNGVYDKPPSDNPNAKLIKQINSSNINEVIKNTGVSNSRIDVTGGMRTKISLLYDICRDTDATGYIFNMNKRSALADILSGDVSNLEFTKVNR